MKIVNPFLKSLFIPALLSLGACSCHKAVVNAPPPPPPAPVMALVAPPVAPPVAAPVAAALLGDVFFDYDKAEIRNDAREQLQTNYSWLKVDATRKVVIEGHCDNRGTTEYNLALGERRATGAKDYLVNLGIDASRLKAVSFGEEKPFAEGNTEEAWSQNRRAHFIAE